MFNLAEMWGLRPDGSNPRKHISDNEWAKACTLRDQYWLYVVFDCATPRPRLLRVRDPFGALIAKAKGGMTIDVRSVLAAAESDTLGGSG